MIQAKQLTLLIWGLCNSWAQMNTSLDKPNFYVVLASTALFFFVLPFEFKPPPRIKPYPLREEFRTHKDYLEALIIYNMDYAQESMEEGSIGRSQAAQELAKTCDTLHLSAPEEVASTADTFANRTP